MKKIVFFTSVLASVLTLVSCEKLNNGRPVDVISGFAQKGYLVEGSDVKAFAYNKEVIATGDVFAAKIEGSLAAFSINVGCPDAAFYEVKADGRYFDETTGRISESEICLEAFVKSSEAKVNLNLLTTITKKRIMNLVSSGMKYDAAREQAQVEFFKTVNMAGADIDFSRMDLTGGSDADAMFLLTTCAMQNGRSASELTAIINKAAEEFAKDGTLSAQTSEELFQPGQELNMETVFDNLKKYYEEHGLPKETLPSYWKYFYLPAGSTIKILSTTGFTHSLPDTESPEALSGTYKILAVEPFEVTTDVNWITFEKRELEKEIYEVTVNIAANTSAEKRVGTIRFVNNDPVILEKQFVQGSILRTLILESDGNLRRRPFIIGNLATVNGRNYPIEWTETTGESCVRVPREADYTISYPAGYVKETSHFGRVIVNYPAAVHNKLEYIFFGGIKGAVDSECRVNMEYSSAYFWIKVKDVPNFWYIKIYDGNGKNVAGKFEYPIYKDNLLGDPDWDPQFVYGDKKEVTVYRDAVDVDGILEVAIPPFNSQSVLHVDVYDTSNKLIYLWHCGVSFLDRGGLFYLVFPDDAQNI